MLHTSMSELLNGQHDDAEQECIMALMCLKCTICCEEKQNIKQRKKTESHSAIEHSSKTEGNQWDYLVCADGV